MSTVHINLALLLGLWSYSCDSKKKDETVDAAVADIAKPNIQKDEPYRDCSASVKDCNGCRGYLDSCCSDKNCNGGRVCKRGKRKKLAF